LELRHITNNNLNPIPSFRLTFVPKIDSIDLELQIILQAISALKKNDFIMRLQGIDGADHAQGAFVQDMGIDHGGLDVGVAKKPMHRAGWFSPAPRLPAAR
jgi:hypothetical protein